MAKYIPKPDDVVFIDGKAFNRYIVVDVDIGKQTARVKSVSRDVNVLFDDDVPWAKLHQFDESQNALRMVREAPENTYIRACHV